MPGSHSHFVVAISLIPLTISFLLSSWWSLFLCAGGAYSGVYRCIYLYCSTLNIFYGNGLLNTIPSATVIKIPLILDCKEVVVPVIWSSHFFADFPSLLVNSTLSSFSPFCRLSPPPPSLLWVKNKFPSKWWENRGWLMSRGKVRETREALFLSLWSRKGAGV